METARLIVREDGADRLTLGRLAHRAGVSKPVVYDHFATRSILLIDLYRWLDTERIDTFRAGMAEGERTPTETVALLAEAFIRCAADTSSEVPAIGAALAGSEEKAAVLQSYSITASACSSRCCGPTVRSRPTNSIDAVSDSSAQARRSRPPRCTATPARRKPSRPSRP